MDIKVSTRTDLHAFHHHYIIISNCEVKEFKYNIDEYDLYRDQYLHWEMSETGIAIFIIY